VSNFSLGVDIEEVERFQKLIRDKRFLKRVFTDEEIAYCFSKRNKAQHFAVRFAAKEAIWKALSETISNLKKNLAHRDIGLKNNARGKPEVILPRALARWSNKICVSLSHTTSYALAAAFVKD